MTVFDRARPFAALRAAGSATAKALARLRAPDDRGARSGSGSSVTASGAGVEQPARRSVEPRGVRAGESRPAKEAVTTRPRAHTPEARGPRSFDGAAATPLLAQDDSTLR